MFSEFRHLGHKFANALLEALRHGFSVVSVPSSLSNAKGTVSCSRNHVVGNRRLSKKNSIFLGILSCDNSNIASFFVAYGSNIVRGTLGRSGEKKIILKKSKKIEKT